MKPSFSNRNYQTCLILIGASCMWLPFVSIISLIACHKGEFRQPFYSGFLLKIFLLENRFIWVLMVELVNLQLKEKPWMKRHFAALMRWVGSPRIFDCWVDVETSIILSRFSNKCQQVKHPCYLLMLQRLPIVPDDGDISRTREVICFLCLPE